MAAALLQIRNVPEETRRALKARASARGESLNSYLLELINRDVSRPTIPEVLQRAARRAEHAGASAVDVMYAARAERGDDPPRRRT
jgi:plasmid stability protein